MNNTIYFQWQNETLLKTIYPKRKEKLIDFLVHFEEIELWKKHEKMPAAEFARRKKKYEVKQEKALVEIVKVYNREKNYFLDENGGVSAYAAKYKDLKADEVADEMERVKKLHKTFQLINPDGKNIYKDDVRKEKIFVAQRAMTWEEYRQKVTDRIFRQRRRVNSIQANARDAENKGLDGLKKEYQEKAGDAQKELERLENQLLKMVDDEMSHLRNLSVAYTKYEKRKLAVKKVRETQQDDLEKKLAELSKKRREVRQLEEELRAVQGRIRGFETVQPNDDLEKIMEVAETILFEDIDWGGMEQVFGVEKKFLERYKGIREYQVGLLKYMEGKDVKLTFVNRWMESLVAIKIDIYGKLDKLEVGDGNEGLIQCLQKIVSQVLLLELERLADYHFVLERIVNVKTAKKPSGLFEENQAREKEIQKVLKAGRAALTKLHKEIAPIRARLDIPVDDELVQYVPDKDITVKDLVIEMANEYRESLANKTHEELLEIIVKLFWDNPERFPLWLQYMVIHFSGMRYASAHGSWADPKELLGNLLTSRREEENRALIDEDEVETQAQAWLRYLRSDGDQIEVEEEEPITLPLSKLKDGDKDDEKKKGEDDSPKIASFSAELEGNFYTKRKALHNLKMLQDKYRIEAMSHQDVLEELKDINEQKDTDGEKILPEWMWNEIVAMTDMRIQEAKDPNWEKLTPEQEAEKNSGKWEKYRAIMNQWKAKNLTDWRSEHESSGQLIVTRAVCNEVAEHIQHMRGHKGAAGLTEKPNWYRWEERNFDTSWPKWKGERTYFKRPRRVEDFKEGASILWLRYVNDFPNEWRIAQPLETKEKDGLIREEYLRQRAPGNWIYTMDDGVPRRRIVTRNGLEIREGPQYLRWMHEATVAEVATTAEGQVVLTFETALPYEDRRLSTIGVFKRYPNNLMDDFGEDGYNPAFVGFVPEAENIPVEHFKEMLNWNKILRRRFKPEAELAAYQEKYIHRRSILPEEEKPGGITVVDSKKVETPAVWAPVDKTKLYRALSWGHEILVKQANLTARAVGSNFNPLPIYSNEGTWSAIANSLVIPREDVDRLIAMQVEDECTVRQKMNWLVFGGTADRPYWCKSGNRDWTNAEKIWWGTIIFGGQLVLTDADVVIHTKLPEEPVARDVPMKRLVCFRKWDWDKTHDTHPWLIQRATEVNQNDKFSDRPRGIIYSPLWSPQDWEFIGKGHAQPEAFYIPTDWLEPYKE